MSSEFPVRCKGCVYWRRLSGSGYATARVCHFLLDTYRVRRRDAEGRCLEFQKSCKDQKKTLAK